MKGFKLFVYKNDSYRILITDYSMLSPNKINLYSTFDEQLSIGEHDQSTLTFSIMRYIYDISSQSATQQRLENSHYKLLTMGSRIELQLDSSTSYLFTITGIKPSTSKNNMRYDYTCQDEVSYNWSRRNLGLSYDTQVDGPGVQSIYDITNTVLKKAKIVDWYAKPDENNETALNTSLYYKKIALTVEDSNPYNIIMEACNTLNAYLRIDYNRKRLSFYQRDKIKFSGYRYRPENNLKQMTVDYGMDEMCTMLHVSGGTDESGLMVNLFPPLDEDMKNWWIDNHHRFIDSPIDFTTAPGRFIPAGSITDPAYPRPFEWHWNLFSPDEGIAFYWQGERSTDITVSFIYRNQTYKKTFTAKPGTSTQVWTGDEFVADTKLDITCMTYSDNEKDRVDSNLLLDKRSDFLAIAQAVPSMGNFLYDFSFFLKSGLLTTKDHERILYILNTQMAYNNMWLKIYEPSYYQLTYQLHLHIADAKTKLEMRQALIQQVRTYDEYNNNAEIQRLTAEYNACMQSVARDLQGLYGDHVYKDTVPANIRSIQFIEQELQRYTEECNYYFIERVRAFEALSTDCPVDWPVNPEKLNADDLARYTDWAAAMSYNLERYSALSGLVGDDNWGLLNTLLKPDYDFETMLIKDAWISFEPMDDDYNLIGLPTVYGTLLKDLYILMSKLQHRPGVAKMYRDYTLKNEELWTNFYNQFAQYIYEGRYDNTEEMDSISLYNQAIIYYQDINKPTGNFTISVIDLTTLELVSTPRLSVGSKIRVYDQFLNLNEDSQSEIQHSNNDLVVTSISYKLRSPADVSIGVMQVSAYLSIVQKLIQNI